MAPNILQNFCSLTRMEKPKEKFNSLGGTMYQLIYFPASDGRPNTDRLSLTIFGNFPIIFSSTSQTYIGLSDLANREFVVRMETNHESMKSGGDNEFAGTKTSYKLNEIGCE
jgi:hypothetical protein